METNRNKNKIRANTTPIYTCYGSAFILIIFILLSESCAKAPSQFFEPSPGQFSPADQELFSRAMKHQKNGQIEPAIGLWERFLEKYPNSYEARNNLGLVYYASNEINLAIDQFEQGLKLTPGSVKIRDNLLRVLKVRTATLEKNEEYDGTIADLKRIAQLSSLGEQEKIERQIEAFEDKIFEQVKKSGSLGEYQNFIKKYPNSPRNSDEARLRIAEWKVAHFQNPDTPTTPTSYCDPNKFLPIDCAEADKNSREVWFQFRAYHKMLPTISCEIFNFYKTTVKVLRNGSVLVRHKLGVSLLNSGDFEFMGVAAKPEGSILSFLGIKDLKFSQFLDIEFDQNIEWIEVKYAGLDKVVKACKIEYADMIRKKLAERKTYENAQSDAIKFLEKTNNVPAEKQERFREQISPVISFRSIDPDTTLRTDSYQTFIEGKVTDNAGILTLLINGKKATIKADGTFTAKSKLRIGENRIRVLAEDVNGNTTEKILTIIREDFISDEILADVDLPPKTTINNPNGIAVVIGVESYQYVSDATYAYNDAEVFREYLADTLGFSKAKIKIITNQKASLAEFNKLLAPNGWLARNVDSGKSELVVYFSGHGIPDPITRQTGLLPFDVDPNYSIGFHLSQLYESLGKLSAKSITVFLDACFTGENRERKMLLADARSIVVVPNEKSIPSNLTVFSAASGGQISGSLKEKEHGLFTYYLLRGLGGDADYNQDKKLTIGELGNYVQAKVKEKAALDGREQAPELRGDFERVLLEW